MLQACLEGLHIHPDGCYVDVTFGGGGHSRAMYEQLGANGSLVAFDQDPDARSNGWEADNFHFVAANFSFLKNHLRALGIRQVDGILADLGVSSHQFDTSSRGFSIRGNDRLDMRMNPQSPLSAHEVINTYDEEDLIRIFRNYGEIDRARKIAHEICVARSGSSIDTTADLIDLVNPWAPRNKEHKFHAQLFQALRIEVNQELEALEKFLLQSAEVIKPGGYLVVMSYHSLEDRLVKNFLKRGNMDGSLTKDFYGKLIKPFDEVNRKPITATEEEISQNPRARSAKLRIAVRNGE